jgi:TM2 domain-containing membrane protein YozV
MAAEPVKKDKNWIAGLLLSILIGSLGIDRFYMGYIGLGILKLITLGGFGVWWLIDVILIASKHEFAKVNWVE